jgi:hypothetical protein
MKKKQKQQKSTTLKEGEQDVVHILALLFKVRKKNRDDCITTREASPLALVSLDR